MFMLHNNEYIRKLYVIDTYYLCQYFAYGALTAIIVCLEPATGNGNIPFADKGLLTQMFYSLLSKRKGCCRRFFHKNLQQKETLETDPSTSKEQVKWIVVSRDKAAKQYTYGPRISRKERMHRRIAFRTYHMRWWGWYGWRAPHDTIGSDGCVTNRQHWKSANITRTLLTLVDNAIAGPIRDPKATFERIFNNRTSIYK